MRENDLIRLFHRYSGAAHPAVEVGIGDDAALIATNGKLVVSVDTMVEGQHFDLAYCDPEHLGDKLLSVSVSDLVAKGARPQWCLTSIAVRASTPSEFIEAVYRGLSRRAQELGVAIVGGNLTRAEGPQWFDLFLAGDLAGEFKSRSSAQVGDRVGVLGNLGEARAGLELLKAVGHLAAKEQFPALVLAQLRPRPPVKDGIALAQHPQVHATIDVSDGLASELFHLSEASSVGFRIWDEKLPLSQSVRNAAAVLNVDPLDWAWNGGEDYTVLFTYAAGSEMTLRASGIAFSSVGEVVDRASGVVRIEASGTEKRVARNGWDPFALLDPVSGHR